MSLPMAVSHVALLFTDVLDQITDTLEPIGFIMRNFNPGKVLKSNKELEPIKPVADRPDGRASFALLGVIRKVPAQ